MEMKVVFKPLFKDNVGVLWESECVCTLQGEGKDISVSVKQYRKKHH